METKDGRTGTLSAGPLPNTPNANIAIQDAAGKSHVVPQAETRLAGSAGQDPSPPAGSATTPATPANPNTPANPSPWGAVTDAHRGLPVETKDGRTGTLLAGPLPDTPDPNVAILDAAGNTHVVPQAETRLAVPPGSDASEIESSSANVGGENANRYRIGPRDPDEGWGQVRERRDSSRMVENRDGLRGKLIGSSNGLARFQSPDGKWHYEDYGNLRLVEPEDPSLVDYVAEAVDEAHKEYEPLFQRLGIPPKRGRGVGMSAGADPFYDPNNPKSRPVVVNLSKEDLIDHVIRKSGDSLELVPIVARSVPREEYTHAVDISDDHEKFLQSPERTRGMSFEDYRKQEKDRTADEIVGAVEAMKDNPEKQQDAINTLETLYRYYKESIDPNHPDYHTTSWPKISTGPQSRGTLVGEAVRQLAQYAQNGDTSELGYLKPLNENKYRERKAFYEKALEQLNQGWFGERLRDKVNSVASKLESP